MYADSQTAQVYREQTISFLRYALGVDAKRPDVHNPIILSFETIGVAVREHYTPEKCQMFLKELVYYINMVEQEQRLRLSGSVASLEEFWHYRLGTSAATVILAVNELSWEGGNLPITFYAEKDVEQLYYYTNTIISALNDVLSVKKEIVSSDCPLETISKLTASRNKRQSTVSFPSSFMRPVTSKSLSAGSSRSWRMRSERWTSQPLDSR